MGTDFSNALKKFKLVFLGEQSGKWITLIIISYMFFFFFKFKINFKKKNLLF